MKTPKDWNDLSQKKDIEEIRNILRSKIDNSTKTIWSICIALITSIIGDFIVSLFDEESNSKRVFILVIVIFAIILFSSIPYWNKIVTLIFKRNRQNFPSNHEKNIITLFDNNTIYNVMTAKRFSAMLTTLPIPPYSINEIKFFKIEARYYVYKALIQIQTINPNMISQHAYTEQKKLISFERLRVVLKIIKDVLDVIIPEKSPENPEEKYILELFKEVNGYIEKAIIKLAV